MFTLRCAFWLSVMYASITFGVGALRSPHAFEAAVAGEASAAGAAVVARATDWCVERPSRCARDAAALNSLVQTVASRDAASDDDVMRDAPRGEVPMPVPAPRRTTRAVLTGSY